MILADTNVIIEYWNNPTDEVRNIFCKNDIATCGIIKTELLRGAKSDKEFNLINEALNSFYFLNFDDDNDWIMLANFLRRLRQNGLSVPFQDAVIAYLSVKYDCQIWTYDKHFKLMQIVIPEIRLYKY